MTDQPNPSEANRIKAHARALYPVIGKLIVPATLAKRLREIGAWDDETMCESKPLPLGRSALSL